VLHGIFGITLLLGVAWLLSENRRVLRWRLILAGLALLSVHTNKVDRCCRSDYAHSALNVSACSSTSVTAASC
jgi:hypothetical protein